MKQISKEEIYLNELNGENDWEYLSQNYILSEDVINEFKDKVIWDKICRYQHLSENFYKRCNVN